MKNTVEARSCFATCGLTLPRSSERHPALTKAHEGDVRTGGEQQPAAATVDTKKTSQRLRGCEKLVLPAAGAVVDCQTRANGDEEGGAHLPGDVVQQSAQCTD